MVSPTEELKNRTNEFLAKDKWTAFAETLENKGLSQAYYVWLMNYKFNPNSEVFQ